MQTLYQIFADSHVTTVNLYEGRLTSYKFQATASSIRNCSGNNNKKKIREGSNKEKLVECKYPTNYVVYYLLNVEKRVLCY